jgi:predicted DNA-binding transcriptional regulator YafY
MGQGRWDAEALAEELDCSVRTVHRVLQTLATAGIPFQYDAEAKAYRVPRGFKFPGLDPHQLASDKPSDPAIILPAAKRLLSDAERFSKSLREFCNAFENL